MKLEDQVLSIEQVQELQELGFDINKYATLYWASCDGCSNANCFGRQILELNISKSKCCVNQTNIIPTLTIGDIMDILPTFIEIGSSKITYKLGVNNYNIQYFNNNNIFIRFENNTQIYRLFQCLVWCIKDNYLNKEINKQKMKKLKFQKGEWCFCEFRLQQVIETEENRITSVSDGVIRSGSSDLSDRCYPLEMDVKCISDAVAFWSIKFHELKNSSLNHPDLNRELIRRWAELCDNRKDENRLKELYDSLNNFGMSVLRKVQDLSFEEVEGVSLFRR